MHGRTLVVWLVLLSLPWAPALAQERGAYDTERGEVLQSLMHKLLDANRTVAAERKPLFEMWTATWCIPCAPADRAVDRALDTVSPGFRLDEDGTRFLRYDETGPEKAENGMSFVAFHPVSVGRVEASDPFGFPEGAARVRDKYGDVWFPSVWVDGVFEDEATVRDPDFQGGLEDLHHDTYRRLVSVAGDRPSPIVLDVKTRIEGDEAVVDVRVTPVRRVAAPVALTGVLWEDGVRYTGENGIEEHRFTARAMLPRASDRDGLGVHEVWTVSWRVDLASVDEVARAGVTVFVEDDWRVAGLDAVEGRMIVFFAAAGVVSLAFLLMSRYERRRREGTGRDGQA